MLFDTSQNEHWPHVQGPRRLTSLLSVALTPEAPDTRAQQYAICLSAEQHDEQVRPRIPLVLMRMQPRLSQYCGAESWTWARAGNTSTMHLGQNSLSSPTTHPPCAFPRTDSIDGCKSMKSCAGVPNLCILDSRHLPECRKLNAYWRVDVSELFHAIPTPPFNFSALNLRASPPT